MASTEDENLMMAAVSLDDLLPLVEALMHSPVGQAGRIHAAAACLVAYFMLSAPRAFSKQELANLMGEGSALLMPLVVKLLLDAPDYVVANVPSKES